MFDQSVCATWRPLTGASTKPAMRCCQSSVVSCHAWSASRRWPTLLGSAVRKSWAPQGPLPGRAGAVAGVIRAVARASGQHDGPVWWRGMLVCAIDGTTLSVADSAANLARFS